MDMKQRYRSTEVSRGSTPSSNDGNDGVKVDRHSFGATTSNGKFRVKKH
jgi:hypothetical protein